MPLREPLQASEDDLVILVEMQVGAAIGGVHHQGLDLAILRAVVFVGQGQIDFDLGISSQGYGPSRWISRVVARTSPKGA